MKIALWIIIGLIALPWTVGAWIAAAVAGWLASRVAAGDIAVAGADIAPWPQPEWLPSWMDPAAITLFQQWVIDSLRTLDAMLPFFGSLLGWIAPLIWFGWALGLLMLVVFGALLHWLIVRGEAGAVAAPAN